MAVHSQRLVKGEWRQDSAQPPGEHGLTGARRSGQQQAVATRCRDLERAPRQNLAADLRKIVVRRHDGGSRRQGRHRALRTVGMIECLQRLRQGPRDADIQTIDDAGLRCVLGRQQETPQALPSGRDGDRQHTANAIDRAIQ